MGMSYAHTLIPAQVDFAPLPSQVAEFLSALEELGATPSDADLAIFTRAKPRRPGGRAVTGRLPRRIGQNPFSGETIGISGRYYTVIASFSGIVPGLEGLDEYEIRMSGQGPRLQLFEFDPELSPQGQGHDFEVSCHLVPHVVSTSDYHRNGVPEAKKVMSFGYTCDTSDTMGYFTSPKNGELIQVPRAGCARFWIKLAFGKSLFPEIKDNSLDLLPASVVDAAKQAFGVSFAQGCFWG